MNIFNELFGDNSIYFDCFDNLPEAIYIYGTDSRMIYMNRAAEQLDDITLQYAKGKSINELYGNDLNTTNSPTLNTIITECPHYNVEMTYYSNGKRMHQLTNTSPIYKDGKFIGVFVFSQNVTVINDLLEENIALRKKIGCQSNDLVYGSDSFSKLIGESKKFKGCKEQARVVAKTNSSVMLVGNTGSGKELFARAIHEHSDRKKYPFLALNCAAIPEGLIEGILFGTTKGVYTGATEKDGLLVQANHGTVFLDEINSMPLVSQAKLLRVLEERKVMKLGSDKERDVDIRIISSINEKPMDAIRNSHLREDLFYRLAVVQIVIPPLNERTEDIPHLVEYYIGKFNKKFNKSIIGVDDACMKVLQNAPWPGNVRQLKASLESAVTLAENKKILSVSDFPSYVFQNGANLDRSQALLSPIMEKKEPAEESDSFRKSLKERFEIESKQEIMNALEKHNGNLSRAAKELGISKQLLSYRMKKYEIK
ncbi:MAG: sigma 54-interacting transcriptional regulator [Firmicutes bacterium]|nr:sigma 54-interacting transcriptional regulator [Bacillota bacterium]